MVKFEQIFSILGFTPNSFTHWEQKTSFPWKSVSCINLILVGFYFLYAIVSTPAALNEEYDKIRWVNVCLTRVTRTVESLAMLYHIYHIKIKGSPHLKSTFGHKFKKPKPSQYLILILCLFYKCLHYYYVYIIKNDFEIHDFVPGVILDSSSFIILTIFSFVMADVSGRLDDLSRRLHVGNAILSTHEHRLLCTLMTSLNKTFGLQIFVICLKYSIHIIRKSYQICLYWIVCSEKRNCEVIFSIDSAIWIFWNFIVIAILVYSCENALKKVEKFISKLFCLMQKEEILCKNEKLFLYVIVKPSVNFTACGFFTLGYPFIGSIIAATVTYLVILLQFSIAGSSE